MQQSSTNAAIYKHNTITRPEIPSHNLNNAILSDLNHLTNSKQYPLYHVVRTQIKPAQTSSGITELKNYIASQKSAVVVHTDATDRRSVIQQQPKQSKKTDVAGARKDGKDSSKFRRITISTPSLLLDSDIFFLSFLSRSSIGVNVNEVL